MNGTWTASDQAVVYLLRMMQRDGRLAYLLGKGSRSFEFLTEAGARLANEPLETYREQFWEGCRPEPVARAET